jgi:glycosyltransferase involved in cell wall biosynthesis
VIRYEEHNQRVEGVGFRAAGGAIWSTRSFHQLGSLIRAHPCDVAHFHNTFPLISPAAYYALRNAGIPIIQTLHNYRLICSGATLLRNGAVCEECIDRNSLVPALVHGCYRKSRAATLSVAAMLQVHSWAGTWRRMVDVYIALSEFARKKFIAGGLPSERIVVKTNFVAPDPGAGGGAGAYALYVGRLSEEKGIPILAQAWRKLGGIPLIIAGDGPLSTMDWPAGVTCLGQQSSARVLALMRDARVLIFPSIWYECAPMSVIEAFACGLPVIASNLGSSPEFVTHGSTGLLFQPGDADALAGQIRWAFDHPEQLRAMRAQARREYQQKYTADHNYKMLLDIYEMAVENARVRRTAHKPIAWSASYGARL